MKKVFKIIAIALIILVVMLDVLLMKLCLILGNKIGFIFILILEILLVIDIYTSYKILKEEK